MKKPLSWRVGLVFLALQIFVGVPINYNAFAIDAISKGNSTEIDLIEKKATKPTIDLSKGHKDAVVEAMEKQLSIVSNEPAANKLQTQQAIRECLKFLADNFGEPLHKEKVKLVVTSNPADNGRMTWSKRSKGQRQIILNEFNLIPSELRVLVHELFHAFYQPNVFVANSPDFVLEGFAMYAEALYRYKDMNRNDIIVKLSAQAESLDKNYLSRCYDPDKPFLSYDNHTRDLMYIISAMFMLEQSIGADIKINDMIKRTSSVKQKIRFTKLCKNLGMISTNFKFNCKKGLGLPRPKKIGATDSSYCVHVLTTGDKEEALELAEALENEGYQSVVMVSLEDHKYNVTTGPYKRVIDSEKDQESIREYLGSKYDVFVKEIPVVNPLERSMQ